MSGGDGPDFDVKRCAKCAAWIPTTATMCAYCNTTSPDQPPERPRGSLLSLRHGVRVTDLLILVNALYLVFAILAEYARVRSGNPVQWLLTASGFHEGLARAGAYHPALLTEGQWWRILSATFLHAGAIHIVLNMISLRSLGRLAEELFGPAKFLTASIVKGAASTLAVSVWSVGIRHQPMESIPIMVGASGSIFGIAGLLAVFLLRAGTERARAIGSSLAWNVVVMLGIGYVIPFISNVAHVGGLLVGVLFGLTVRDQFSSRIDLDSNRRWTVFASLCVAAAVLSLLAAAWFAVTYKGGF